jgi:hypothetical protein
MNFIVQIVPSQNYSQSENHYQGQRICFLSSSVDRYFKSIQSNLKLTLGANRSNFKNSVNNSNLREVKTLMPIMVSNCVRFQRVLITT